MIRSPPPAAAKALLSPARVKLRCLCRRYGPRKRWPDSLGITIPTHLCDALGWKERDQIQLRVTGTGRILVERVEGENKETGRGTKSEDLWREFLRVDATQEELREELAEIRRQLRAASPSRRPRQPERQRPDRVTSEGQST